MNILLILADQFASHALNRPRSSDGHFKTPNLDKLAAQAVNFTQAYTTFPLCVPARSSLVTGRYPHELGTMSNAHAESGAGNLPKSHSTEEPGRGEQSLGRLFSAAGYDCGYAGKWHARAASCSPEDGFEVVHPFGDEGLVESCTTWLTARNKEKPFLLVASFDDPHTICEYARGQAMPYGDVVAGPASSAPPLPLNFSQRPYQAQALNTEQEQAQRVYGTQNYDAGDWRRYREVYASLVERVDARIGQLLAAKDLENTAVVFLSDHGDGDSSHAWNQKTALHEECIRVPFLVHSPKLGPGKVRAPVPAILGLLPTLCELAAITPPDHAIPSLLSELPEQVLVQTSFADTVPLKSGAPSSGRSLIWGDYKYTVYSWGKHREQLHNLLEDPHEMRNLAEEDCAKEVLESARMRLLEWCLANADTAFLKKLVFPHSAQAEAARKQVFAVPY